MLNPFSALAHETEMMVAAGRSLAWNSGADVETMEILIRKVAAKARSSLINRMVLPGANDDEEDRNE